MNRITELERFLRDRTLTGIRINLSRRVVDLDLTERDGEMTSVTLTGVTGIDWSDDSLNEFCISHVKCLSDSERTILVLDPYDERVEDVLPQDNMVVQFAAFEIKTSEIAGDSPDLEKAQQPDYRKLVREMKDFRSKLHGKVNVIELRDDGRKY
ncbi:hypothetical protein [Leptonema illini]|uniref:Uncharacterized protein n=1 Tax=Leptonema illini DSM 21528 TaxID=929563 RepID=H2CI40_9LEPT|nr:hypothetical protein [Leptonema illini]EHQ08063.1 hypothetical protein Lepil_3404 [Leptonema illini DSM 21528]